MSGFVVEILPAAEREFQEAFLWYFERSPLATDAFRSEVLDAIDALADDADVWPKNEDGISVRVLTRFPYTVYYDVVGNTATVLAIAHQRRKPGYWRDRRGSVSAA